MINLLNGDCIELMHDIPDKSVDLVLCDPPYATTEISWDSALPLDKLWESYKRIIKDNGTIVLFGAEPFSSQLRMSNLDMYRYDWVWIKNRFANFAQAPYMPIKNTENICVFSKATIAQNSKNRMTYNPQGVQDCNVLVKYVKSGDFRPGRATQGPYTQRGTNYPNQLLMFDKDTENYHPTQKPVALLQYLIKTYTSKGDTVLDNCMGSGSTGVACVLNDRDFIGIELDEKYFHISEERITQAEKDRKRRLFDID